MISDAREAPHEGQCAAAAARARHVIPEPEVAVRLRLEGHILPPHRPTKQIHLHDTLPLLTGSV